MSNKLYVAEDGSYGDAEGLVIIDTEHWPEKVLYWLDYATDARDILSLQKWAKGESMPLWVLIEEDEGDSYGYLEL